MRNTLLNTVAALGLLAGSVSAPALAQTGSTQSPPAPGSSASMPQPTNSLPAGAATSQSAPGGTNMNGSTSQVPTTPRTGRPAVVAPVPMPVATPAPVVPPVVVAPGTTTPVTTAPVKPKPPMRARRMGMKPKRAPATDATAEPVADDTGAPPTGVYRGGVGSPLSTQAANLRPGREMGSRLPDPETAGASPRDYLAAAMTALNRGQTGKAQEALERAETRILSRTTEPSRAAEPDQAAMARSIATARQALGNRDVRGAKAAITAAMGERVPGPGPAVSTPAM